MEQANLSLQQSITHDNHALFHNVGAHGRWVTRSVYITEGSNTPKLHEVWVHSFFEWHHDYSNVSDSTVFTNIYTLLLDEARSHMHFYVDSHSPSPSRAPSQGHDSIWIHPDN